MKFDKETLVKQKFWVALSASVGLTLIVIIFLAFIAPRATGTVRTKVQTRWDKFKKPDGLKNPEFIEVAKKAATFEKANETKVWEKAARAQDKLFTWPKAFENEFQFQNGLFATEVAVQGKDAKADGPEEPKKDDAKKEEDQSTIHHFQGKLIEFNAEYILVQGGKGPAKKFRRMPPEYIKITTADKAQAPDGKDRAPLWTDLEKAATDGAIVAVTYFQGRRFNDPLTDRERKRFEETYESQLLPILNEASPENELGEVLVQFAGWPWDKTLKTPPPATVKFFRYVPEWKTADLDISEEAWIAQEDLWVQRELFRLVKKANDSVANFEAVKGTPGRFVNPYWQMDVLGVEGNQVKIRLTNRLDRLQQVNIHFQVQFAKGGPFTAIKPIKDSDPLAPAGTRNAEGKARDSVERTLKVDGPVGKQVVGVRQVLTWETAAVRRIDQVSVGSGAGDEWSHSHRTSHKPLRPFKPKPATADKEADPKTPPSPPMGPMRPMRPMGPNGPGGGGPGAERTTNGLISDRYLDVTPQSRRLPVAIALIVDQAHVARVQAAFADSPLRFLTTQVLLHRYPKTVRPDSPGQQLAGAEGQPPPGPAGMRPGAFPPGAFPPRTFPPRAFPPPRSPMGPREGPGPGPGRRYGSPYARPPVYAGQPGATFGGEATPTAGGDEQESNMELVLYGVVSLYEPYPPRPPLTSSAPPEGGTPMPNP